MGVRRNPCPDSSRPPGGLALAELHDITSQQRYGVEYQPLVCVASGEIAAFEALARFYRADGSAVAPMQFFEVMHCSTLLLHQVEFQLKRLQLAEAPAGYDLFLNVDPHAVMPAEDGGDGMLELIAQEPRVVVELIENTDIQDARASETLHQQLARLGVRTALDDIGAPHALLSLELLTRVDYMKFDRSWLATLDNPPHRQLFVSLLDFARQSGKRTVLEGVETGAMLAQAKAFAIDYVQGFLFRPHFITQGNPKGPR